jgi:hypothetical protein
MNGRILGSVVRHMLIFQGTSVVLGHLPALLLRVQSTRGLMVKLLRIEIAFVRFVVKGFL